MRPITEIRADATAWLLSGAMFTTGDVSAPSGREVLELCDEVEKLREAIVDCHRWACTVHCCMLDGGPEHDEAFKAAKAAEGGEV